MKVRIRGGRTGWFRRRWVWRISCDYCRWHRTAKTWRAAVQAATGHASEHRPTKSDVKLTA